MGGGTHERKLLVVRKICYKIFFTDTDINEYFQVPMCKIRELHSEREREREREREGGGGGG